MSTLKLDHVLDSGVTIRIQADKLDDGERRVAVAAPSVEFSPRFDFFKVEGPVLPLRLKSAVVALDKQRKGLEDEADAPECGKLSKEQAQGICEELNAFFDA